MEIVVLIVAVIVVFVILFIAGGIDNNRPVSTWSDEKLQRMHGKLSYAGSAAMKAGQHQSAKEHFDKLEEVKAEIERRKAQHTNDLVSKVSSVDVTEVLNSNDAAQLIGMMGSKMAELTQRTMSENSCSEERAGKIITAKIEEIEAELKSQGLSEDQVAEEAMKRILLL